MLVAGSEARFYSWDGLSDSKTRPSVRLECGQDLFADETKLESPITTRDGRHIVANYCRLHGDRSTTRVAVWDTSSTLRRADSAEQIMVFNSSFERLHENARCMLGLHGSRMFLLNRQLWVCSIDLDTHDGISYTRHFFVPNDFLGGDVKVLGLITPDRNIAFAKDGELALIKGGLDFEDIVAFEPRLG